MGSGASREEAILRKKNASTTERNNRLKRAVLESREPGRHTAAEQDSMHAWERSNQLSMVMAEKAMARDQARRALQEEEARQRLQKAEERGRMLQDGASGGLDPRHEKASEAQNDEVESRKRVKQEHSRRKERIVNQVRTDVQALLELEFDTQEDFEATLEEYVERIRLLERREEEGERSKAQRNNNKLEKQAHPSANIPQDLTDFMPVFMSDLAGRSQREIRMMRAKLKESQNLSSLALQAASAQEYGSSSEEEPTRNGSKRRSSRRRRRRTKATEKQQEAEAELELLLDEAAHRGIGAVARVLITYGMQRAPKMFFPARPFRSNNISVTTDDQGAMNVSAEADKELRDEHEHEQLSELNGHNNKVDIMRAAPPSLGMGQKVQDLRWRAVAHPKNARDAAGYQNQCEDLSARPEQNSLLLQKPGFCPTALQISSLTTEDCHHSSVPSSAGSASTVTRLRQTADYDDVYCRADTVGAILCAESADKRGDYFGEVSTEGGSERCRNGLGQLRERNGSILLGRWDSDKLNGMAIRIDTDGSYSIGFHKNDKLSGLGFQRPARGGKFGYCGTFLNGQRHGFGFKVSMLKNSTRPFALGPADRLASSLQSFEHGFLLEEFEVHDANAELEGLKKRLGSGLRIAFEEVKEAAEYTSIPQPWLRDGEHLLLLLLSIHVCLVPSTPLQDDHDYAYLKTVVELHSRPHSAATLEIPPEKNPSRQPSHDASSKSDASRRGVPLGEDRARVLGAQLALHTASGTWSRESSAAGAQGRESWVASRPISAACSDGAVTVDVYDDSSSDNQSNICEDDLYFRQLWNPK